MRTPARGPGTCNQGPAGKRRAGKPSSYVESPSPDATFFHRARHARFRPQTAAMFRRVRLPRAGIESEGRTPTKNGLRLDCEPTRYPCQARLCTCPISYDSRRPLGGKPRGIGPAPPWKPYHPHVLATFCPGSDVVRTAGGRASSESFITRLSRPEANPPHPAARLRRRSRSSWASAAGPDPPRPGQDTARRPNRRPAGRRLRRARASGWAPQPAG